jgi:periplasmic protein TonB
MRYPRNLALIVFIAISISGLAQLPSQTVIFKVRKAKASDLAIAVKEEKVTTYLIVEESAIFQGGDLTTFKNWVQSKVVYPPFAAENEIEGKVVVQFIVTSKGKVDSVKIVRGVYPEIDQEVIRVLRSSPVWVPGKQGGKAIDQSFILPVIFKLQ